MHVIARGEGVMLRAWLADDRECFVRWMAHGEWRLFDAPWYGFGDANSTEGEERNREWFAQQLEASNESWLSRRAVVATPDTTPIGWVSRYGEERSPDVCFVGIDICEDAFLNRGLGTAALKLWVDHLFAASDMHKIALDTWSLSPRMIRVAEKVGFVFEGREREVRHWQGEWLDLLHFGILREEWQRSRQPGGAAPDPACTA